MLTAGWVGYVFCTVSSPSLTFLCVNTFTSFTFLILSHSFHTGLKLHYTEAGWLGMFREFTVPCHSFHIPFTVVLGVPGVP